MRIAILIIAVVAGIAVALLAWYLTRGAGCEEQITCSSDEQCGGEVSLTLTCRDGNVYSEGQRNTCKNPGTCEATCETSFEPWLVDKCSNGCELGVCLS